MEINSSNSSSQPMDLPAHRSSNPVPHTHPVISNESLETNDSQLDALSIQPLVSAYSTNFIDPSSTNSLDHRAQISHLAEYWTTSRIGETYQKLERIEHLEEEFKKYLFPFYCPPDMDPGEFRAQMRVAMQRDDEILQEQIQLRMEISSEMPFLLRVWRAVQERQVSLEPERYTMMSRLVEKYFGKEAFDIHKGLIERDAHTEPRIVDAAREIQDVEDDAERMFQMLEATRTFSS